MAVNELREVNDEQFTFMLLKLDWDSPGTRLHCARAGIALNKLYNDKIPHIRFLCASHGYKLDVLKNDPDHAVRDEAEEAGKRATYQKAKEMTDEIFRQAGCL